MKDKEIMEVLLRSFKNGEIDIDYSCDYLLRLYSDSKRFNRNSFFYGFYFGSILASIVIYILI